MRSQQGSEPFEAAHCVEGVQPEWPLIFPTSETAIAGDEIFGSSGISARRLASKIPLASTKCEEIAYNNIEEEIQVQYVQ